MATLAYITNGEARIVRKLIKAILARNLDVSVFDGEETTLERSVNMAAILAAMATTDSDTLTIRDESGKRVAWFMLVYGNEPDGSELIADYSVMMAERRGVSSSLTQEIIAECKG